MYRRCEKCHRPLKQRVWRSLGYGLDCAIRYGLWIPPALARLRHPQVVQAETLFDLLGDPEDEAEMWTTQNDGTCSEPSAEPDRRSGLAAVATTSSGTQPGN